MSHPGDVYEQEADRVAEQVMRMPAPAMQRSCASGAAGGSTCLQCAEKFSVQRKTKKASREEAVPDVFLGDLGPGRPLDAASRSFFELRFGCDFSGVRVHTDARAAESTWALGARGYTVGRDIVLGERRYAPETSKGRELLAHELAHVIQQSQGLEAQTSTAAAQSEGGQAAAAQAVAGQPRLIHTTGAGGIQRQALSKEEIERRIAEIEEELSSRSFPDEEERLLWDERNALYGQLQSAGLATEVSEEERHQRARRQRWQRLLKKMTEAQIEESLARTTKNFRRDPTDWKHKLDVEVLQQEQERRIQERRSKPVQSPKTVAEAISMLEEARREAEEYSPPNPDRALEMVSSVEAWLRPITRADNMDRHFGDLSFYDSAVLFPGKAYEEVLLRKRQLVGGLGRGGHWKFTINTVKAAREYLEVLAGERALESSSIPGVHGTHCNFYVYDSTESTGLGKAWAVGAAALAAGAWGGYAIPSGSDIETMLSRILKKFDEEKCGCTEEIQFWSHGSAANAMHISSTWDEITASDFNIADLATYGNGPSPNDTAKNTAFYRKYRAWFSGLTGRQQLLVQLRRTICGPSAEVYYRSCEAFQGTSGKEFAKKSAEFWRSKVVGHTKLIGLTQPGKKVLRPGEEPSWEDSEGAGGTEMKKGGQKPKKD